MIRTPESISSCATCWALSALAFVVFLLLVEFDDRVLQVEIAYTVAAAVLGSALFVLFRRG